MQTAEATLFKGLHMQSGILAQLTDILFAVDADIPPLPIRCASGISTVLQNHRAAAEFIVISRRISLPFGRRTRYTLSKNLCGSG